MRSFRVYHFYAVFQFRIRLRLLAGVVLSFLTLCTGSAQAQDYTYHNLLNFNGMAGVNESAPLAGLTIDSHGNLCGTISGEKN